MCNGLSKCLLFVIQAASQKHLLNFVNFFGYDAFLFLVRLLFFCT